MKYAGWHKADIVRVTPDELDVHLYRCEGVDCTCPEMAEEMTDEMAEQIGLPT